MPHAFSGWRGLPGNESHHRFFHMASDPIGGLLFSAAADLTDHDYRLSSGIAIEKIQNIDKFKPMHRIAADAHAARLAHAPPGSLVHCRMRQRPAPLNHADSARPMNVPWHDADLTLPRGNGAGAIGTQELGSSSLQISFHSDHVPHRDAFSNTDDQRNARVRRFHNRICGEWRGYIDHADIGCRLANGARDGIEDRNAFEPAAPFAGGYSRDHLSPVLLARFGMKLAGGTGDALGQNPSLFADQDRHAYFTACTIFSAPSAIVSAEMIGRPESARIFRPNSTFVPCIRTTNGTLILSSRAASTTPCARTSQRMIPPKILIKTPRTLASERMILKAWATLSLVAPPPTSRKLAGSPPQSLIISIVAMAKPAPLTMHPMLPSKEM